MGLAVIEGAGPLLIVGVVKIDLYYPTDRLPLRGHCWVTGNKVFFLTGLSTLNMILYKSL